MPRYQMSTHFTRSESLMSGVDVVFDEERVDVIVAEGFWLFLLSSLRNWSAKAGRGASELRLRRLPRAPALR